jgi:S-(hydroxymethyl)glutathione dehydrogenase / alcohol dehydrogenase
VAPAEPIEALGVVLERRGEPPRLVPLVVAAPGAGEVRVRMAAAGVCHTDLMAVRDARSVPVLLGHEGAGRIEAVGEGVDPRRIGEPVVLAWRLPCGACRRCRAGRAEHCDAGTPAANGGLRRAAAAGGGALERLLGVGCFVSHVVMPAAAAIPVPRDTPLEVAAVVGCAVATGVGAALWTARVAPGESVAVWGAGAVGLNVVSGARIAGASPIVAVDPSAERRADALARGATHAAHPGEASAAIAAAGGAVDHAFDVVGEPETMRAGLAALARGGQLVLIGAAPRDAVLSFHPRAFMSAQHRITGCIYGSVHPATHLPRLLDWAADGTLPVAAQIARRVALEDLPELFGEPPTGERTVVELR